MINIERLCRKVYARPLFLRQRTWGHVTISARLGSQVLPILHGRILNLNREAEVGQLRDDFSRFKVSGEQDVGRLDVSMQVFHLVKVEHTIGNAGRDVREEFRRSVAAGKGRGQVATVAIFQHEAVRERRGVIDSSEETNDICMVQFFQRHQLSRKTIQSHLRSRGNFHRDVLFAVSS